MSGSIGGSGKSSAFQRLTSTKLPPKEQKAQESMPFDKKAQELQRLKSSVDSIDVSVKNINSLASDEVAASNQQASTAEVRDVEKAAALAADLANRIVAEEQTARSAQVDDLSPESVEKVLD